MEQGSMRASGREFCGTRASLRRGLRVRTPSLASRLMHTCRSSASESSQVYQGRYGPWQLDAQDYQEVWGYRVGITGAAAATLACASLAFLPEDGGVRSVITSALNPLCFLGAASLGVSLQLIHIYVAPIKRAIQTLWLMGFLGSIYLMVTNDAPAALVVMDYPICTFLVGPIFAALTGVAFKEGMCYGKAEAAGLFFIVPLLFLGHLTNWVPIEGQRGLLAAFCILFTVFAARKYTQPVKDDVGDKSVFAFLAMPPDQQQSLMSRMGNEDENN